MAQCKKILDDGQRCSNRAVPGLDYCDHHRQQERIKFRRVPNIPSVPPPKETAPKKKTPAAKESSPPPPPEWVASPGSAAEQPAFPDLKSDPRRIRVAPQAVIWLGKAGGPDQTTPLSTRLQRLLANLSQEIALAQAVTVRLAPQGAGALVSLTPSQPEQVDLSRLYDAVADAAAFSGGLLYIGRERAFIQYRDAEAPHGYDATGVKLPAGDDLYLVDRKGTHPISPQALTETPLNTFLLSLPLLPNRGAGLPEVAFALVAPAMYRLLARYFQDHHLRYRLARFHAPQSKETLVLFEIAPRPDAPTGTLIPAFVLAYLQGLPRSVVLTEVWLGDGRRMLVEWRQRHPCRPGNIVGAFPADSLLLCSADSDFPNLCVSPSPAFFEGDELIVVQSSRPVQAELTPLNDDDAFSLELPVRLAPDPGPTPNTAALILNAQEMAWVRRLFYRLPGEAFEAYRLCIGQEWAVLLSQSLPVEGLPFGISMRRMQDTPLFMPLRARFRPSLPWTLLAETLELQPEMYTFLAPEFRLDIPQKAFEPLSQVLVADPDRETVDFTVCPPPVLPRLEWTPAPQPEQPEPERRFESSPPGRGPAPVRGEPPVQLPDLEDLQDIWGGRADSPPTSDPKPDIPPPPEKKPVDLATVLWQQAEKYRQQGDYLAAAMCFALAGDQAEAGRWFRAVGRKF